MIGVALVVFAAVFAASREVTSATHSTRRFAGDLAHPQHGRLLADLRADSPLKVGGREGVETSRRPPARRPRSTVARDAQHHRPRPGTLTKVVEPRLGRRVDDGTCSPGSRRERSSSPKWAEDNGVSVGDTVTLKTPTGDRIPVRVVGSVRDRVGLVVTAWPCRCTTLREVSTPARTSPTDRLRPRRRMPMGDRDRIDQVLEDRSQTPRHARRQELKQSRRTRSTSSWPYLCPPCALGHRHLFGVVNTLVLTIYERTREIGMLRAIGASKSQIRR